MSLVDISSVSDPVNRHQAVLVVYLVQDAEVSDADAPDVLFTFQLLDSRRPWVGAESVDPVSNPLLEVPRELREELPCGGFEPNGVGHEDQSPRSALIFSHGIQPDSLRALRTSSRSKRSSSSSRSARTRARTAAR